MTCAILTPERVDRLLRGNVSAAERPLLVGHLSVPCDECLDVLAGPAGEAMLERLGGGGLTAPESERIFAAAAAVAPPATRARPSRRALGGAVAAALASAAALLLWASPRAGWREKGAALPGGSLIPLAAVPGLASSVRLLPRAAKLGHDEVLLMRLRVTAPAFVYLLGMGERGPALILWPDADEKLEKRPPGEFELARGGRALSIDPRALGAAPQIVLIASPAPLDRARLQALPRGAREIAAALPGCGIDVLPLDLEPR